MKPVSCYLLGHIFIFLLQAVSSDMDRQEWSFSFPDSIKALKNSDVIIPCTFTSPINHSEVNLIWYKYDFPGYPQVFNSKDPSKVIEKYRGRTTLVSNGTNNCTLRIKDVTETEWFYPGISEKINSYDLNNKQSVRVKVTAVSSDLLRKQWKFSFPDSIKVLKNSDVTIPCTFTAPIDHREVNVIWFRYQYIGYPQVFNSKDPSQVIEEYRGRTSLVANGTNSCTLKIKDVRETGRFYPGISEEINSYDLNDDQSVHVIVTGCLEDSSCDKWTFKLPIYIEALKGSCVDIPCTFTHPEDAKDFNFFWYIKKAKIFNNKIPSDVADEYKGRTFLIGNTENDCSLKIINVTKSEDYYPGINDDINSFRLKNENVKGFVTVYIKEEPPKPSIKGAENIKDQKTVNISCSVEYTCSSHPPTLTWNITGHPIMEIHRRSLGRWRMKSIMTYTASYTDDKRVLQCAATFPNNKTSVNIITLNIKYRPRSVTISVDDDKNTQEGDDVTLFCSSQANPPVHNYTWYRIGQGGKLLQGYGDKISVKNTTTEKYRCAATNEMGTEESSVFGFTKQLEKEKIYLYAGIGTGAGLVFIIVLIVLFCIFRRKRKTSVLKLKGEEKTQQEAIPMDDHLYGNIDQEQMAIPRQSSSELQDSSHIYSNTDSEQIEMIKNTKEEQTANSDGVIYTLLELPVPGEAPQKPTTPLETEYATVKH